MIKSVSKTLRILKTVSDNKNKPLPLSQIAENIGENKSTCAHLIKTLTEEGYLEKVSRNEGYTLGPATYYLTRYGKYENDFIAFCRPALKYLYTRTEETIVLAVIKNNTKFIIDYIDKDGATFEDKASIRIDDIYRTATGRTILAHMHKQSLLEIYKTYGNPLPEHWNGISSFTDLCKALLPIKKQNVLKTFTTKKEKYEIGYAVPIYKKSECVASLGIAVQRPLSEYDLFLKEQEPVIISALLHAGKEMSNRLAKTDFFPLR